MHEHLWQCRATFVAQIAHVKNAKRNFRRAPLLIATAAWAKKVRLVRTKKSRPVPTLPPPTMTAFTPSSLKSVFSLPSMEKTQGIKD
jgi:hypothetical protein